MPMLENPKYEAFAQAVANGSTGVQAYKDHVSNGCTTKSAIERASHLLRDVNVSSRVESLRKTAEETLEKHLGWNKLKAMTYLVEVLETPIGEVDQNHRLAQEISFDSEGQMKIKLPAKNDAMKQLSAMTSWNEPEKVEVTHSGHIEHTHSFDGVLQSIIDSGSPVTRRIENSREIEAEVIPVEAKKKTK